MEPQVCNNYHKEKIFPISFDKNKEMNELISIKTKFNPFNLLFISLFQHAPTM